jgi:AbrB family looped-hinge helix DNA binding protein
MASVLTTWELVMTVVKVGPKGQIVIPKVMRDRLGIRAGSTVRIVLDEVNEVVAVRAGWDDPILDGPRVIQSHGVLPEAEGKTMEELLLEMRREDDALWEPQFDRWTQQSSSSTPSLSRRSSEAGRERETSRRS